MDVFPPLAAGALNLPLSGRTAAQLVAALVAGGDEQCNSEAARLLSAALRRDAPLALWSVCRAAARGHDTLLTIDEVADWLAGTIVEELAWDAAPGQSLGGDLRSTSAIIGAVSPEPRWAHLAARSYGVARLAEAVAEHNGRDPAQAYLLGLLHAATEWFEPNSAAARSSRQDSAKGGTQRQAKKATRPTKRSQKTTAAQPTAADIAAALPPWLLAALDQVAAHRGQVQSPADCVAAALRMVGPKQGMRANYGGIKFNRRRHTAEVAAARREWLEPSSSPCVLPELAARLRRLQTLERHFERTLEKEKLDSLKELAYGAGHEINNPLANISARAQTLLDGEHDPARRRLLAAINTQAFRAYEMIADMMLFARPPQPQTAEVDLVALVRSVVDELTTRAGAQHTELVVDASTCGQVLSARIDKTQIAVALRALCANALEALGEGGEVRVAVDTPARHQPAPANSSVPGETVQIAVTDNGPGIPPEVRRHIFDPFYSGREAGRGLGFGLSKCWRIVSMHGGRIDVESTPGQGATFTITLPAPSAG